jgi:hypothetical protein
MHADQRQSNQRPRPPGERRLPRRPTDWAAAVAARLLIALGVIAAAGALCVGMATHSAIVHQAHLDAAQRYRVAAVLTRDAAFTPPPTVEAPSLWL